MSQLALPLKLDDYAVFETFHDSGNEAAVDYLARFRPAASAPGCWLWGVAATGKSHLLQAVCARFGSDSGYVPLADVAACGTQILDGLSRVRVLCIDDVQRVAGEAEWERALFSLYNDLREAGHGLIVAADLPARDVPFGLADLRSRFTALASYELQPLSDEERQQALKLRARHRGLELPDETARFLLTRERRDMASLYGLLDRLDSEALAAKRRLTIPFVKSVLGHRG